VVVYEKSADQKVFPASTTKMMTAIVALEHYPLQQVLTVTQEYPIGQYIGFKPGEKITVEEMLYGLLVQSGNDAAEILAENFPGGRAAFIAAMNVKAQQIHLTNTNFVNPSGVDEDGHYSTAADLARLGDFALRNDKFAKIVATENAVVTSVDYTSSHILNNVNQLLGKVIGVRGIKTGYTEGAGQSLVTLVERDNHSVILAVLGSQDRFADSQALIEWVYSNFQWAKPNPGT
jgi:D-alanyl-D-alanine carboxypeptidase (penicillin-binding protein 5/6)